MQHVVQSLKLILSTSTHLQHPQHPLHRSQFPNTSLAIGGSPPRTEIPGKVSSPPPPVFFSSALRSYCQLSAAAPPPPLSPLQFFGNHDPAISLLFIYLVYCEFSFYYFFSSFLRTLLSSTTQRGVQVTIWPLVPNRAVHCTQMFLVSAQVETRTCSYTICCIYFFLLWTSARHECSCPWLGRFE